MSRYRENRHHLISAQFVSEDRVPFRSIQEQIKRRCAALIVENKGRCKREWEKTFEKKGDNGTERVSHKGGDHRKKKREFQWCPSTSNTVRPPTSMCSPVAVGT